MRVQAFEEPVEFQPFTRPSSTAAWQACNSNSAKASEGPQFDSAWRGVCEGSPVIFLPRAIDRRRDKSHSSHHNSLNQGMQHRDEAVFFLV